MNQIKNIGAVREGQKVVLSIEGTLIKDAKVHVGTGTEGKPRVWFCQNSKRGSKNANPYGYAYAFSVGVNSDGTLRLGNNGVDGLREWTVADERVTEVTVNGVTYSDGRASGGDLKFASIGKFQDAINKNQTAADTYRARYLKYDELAIRNGWTRAYLCR